MFEEEERGIEVAVTGGRGDRKVFGGQIMRTLDFLFVLFFDFFFFFATASESSWTRDQICATAVT